MPSWPVCGGFTASNGFHLSAYRSVTVRDMLAAQLRRLAGAATSLALWLREGGDVVNPGSRALHGGSVKSG